MSCHMLQDINYDYFVSGTTQCFGKIRCVFLIRVFVFGEGRNPCDISPQTESLPNNILPPAAAATLIQYELS